jgi:hypothetical protein
VPLLLEGRLGTTEGRRATSRATLAAEDDPGTVLAEGEAQLVALRPERAEQVFAPTGCAVTAWTSRN